MTTTFAQLLVNLALSEIDGEDHSHDHDNDNSSCICGNPLLTEDEIFSEQCDACFYAEEAAEKEAEDALTPSV